MKHTFLFEQGKWIASGVYYDEHNNEIQIEGQTVITHGGTYWVNDGYMKLLLSEPIEYLNRYEIVPFVGDSWITSWQSDNPALGRLKGVFTIVKDSIISKYESEDKRYSGCEYLLKIDDKTYENRGVVFKGNDQLSSWAVQLKRA